MDLKELLEAFGTAFIVSFVLTPIVRDVFRSYNVVDRPGRRKVHAYPIPRVGGVPIAVAYLVALMTLRGPGSAFPIHWLQTILSGAVVIFLTGLIDDFFNLKPVVKLLGQVVASAVAFANGLSIDHLGTIALPVWLRPPVTIFWLLLTTNALNLIDGLDGLSAGIGFWATLAFVAAAALHGSPLLAFTALPLAGALLGFLFFNFNPATVFLGDSGALLIGFLLGCYGIIWTGRSVTLTGAALPLLALFVPVMDLGLAIVRRRLKKQPVFSADRGHIHHRLLDRGLTVRRVAGILYAVGIAGGIAGLLLSYPGSILPRIVVAAGVAAVTLAGIRELRYAEFEVAARLLFQGEFHRVFADKLRMEQLAQTLERAQNRDEWWRLLVAAAREWNWIRLQWFSDSAVREEVLAVARKPVWSFVIRLSDSETVQVEGDEHAGGPSPDLLGLSSVLSRTFLQRGSREREQPAVS